MVHLMSTLAHDRTQLAREITSWFASLPAVEGVCLFGSIARGEPDEWSDIDLLVVGHDDDLRPTTLLRTLPGHLRGERVSLVCYSKAELQELFDAGSSFVDHIRHEGRVLYDRSGFLGQIVRGAFAPRLNVDEELAAELARLEMYDDLSLFKGNFSFCLAQLYAIGKAVVILGLLAEGQREYSRERAFVAFRRRHPELANEIETVARLRPFYRRVTRREPEALPFSYRGAEVEVERSIDAVRSIASVIR
jgi:predicted nucleotidyltransferase